MLGEPDTTSTKPAPYAWALYDDSCGVCRSGVSRWEKTLARYGIAIAPLQAPWVRERLGLSEEELQKDFRLLLADARGAVGADAYRVIMRRIWWMFPVYLASILPGGRFLFNLGYKTFARNRHRISHVCGLTPSDQK